jgi:hypothetical protein
MDIGTVTAVDLRVINTRKGIIFRQIFRLYRKIAFHTEDGDPCDLRGICETFCFVLFCFVLF